MTEVCEEVEELRAKPLAGFGRQWCGGEHAQARQSGCSNGDSVLCAERTRGKAGRSERDGQRRDALKAFAT
jgi:hypothetical protein